MGTSSLYLATLLHTWNETRVYCHMADALLTACCQMHPGISYIQPDLDNPGQCSQLYLSYREISGARRLVDVTLVAQFGFHCSHSRMKLVGLS